MWITGLVIPFAVLIFATVAQNMPNCENGQIIPTSNKTEYLAFTGNGGIPCTWFVNAPQGETVTVEIKKPEPNQGQLCGLTIFDQTDTFLNCADQKPYVSSGPQLILRYNITGFNITYYVVLTPKTTDQGTTLTTAAVNPDTSKSSDGTTTMITTGTTITASSEASKPSDGTTAATATAQTPSNNGTMTTAAASMTSLSFLTILSSIGLANRLIEHRFGLNW